MKSITFPNGLTKIAGNLHLPKDFSNDSFGSARDAFRRAGSRDKHLHIVEGATHVAMYDTPEYVKAAMDQLVPLNKNAGKASSANNFVGPLSAHTAKEVAPSAA
jgi:hypothetical protein